MASVAVVVRGGDPGKMEWRSTRYVRIHKQHRLASLQVGDMLDLQLVILDQIGLRRSAFRLQLAQQQRCQRVVAARFVADGEDEEGSGHCCTPVTQDTVRPELVEG